jgi:hypothetical protein
MAEHALAYMKHTSKVTLEYYRKSGPLFLKSYVDLNWASSKERKSTNMMVHLLNDSIIAWSSKKQATIILSTGEAEYVTASESQETCIILKHSR